MQEYAEGYRDFVLEQIAEAKKTCKDPLICVEQVLDFSKWVEHGFGTGDCVIVADDLLQIIDYKYGMGVLVSASGSDGTGNSQLNSGIVSVTPHMPKSRTTFSVMKWRYLNEQRMPKLMMQLSAARYLRPFSPQCSIPRAIR